MAGITQDKQKALFLLWFLNKNSRNLVVSREKKIIIIKLMVITKLIRITIMIIAITVVIIKIIIIINVNNNENVSENQVIWFKKCFLRLYLKVFKLSVFFSVCGILFQNEGSIKDKAFWPVFVFWKGRLSFQKLFLKLTLHSGANSNTSLK